MLWSESLLAQRQGAKKVFLCLSRLIQLSIQYAETVSRVRHGNVLASQRLFADCQSSQKHRLRGSVFPRPKLQAGESLECPGQFRILRTERLLINRHGSGEDWLDPFGLAEIPAQRGYGE